MKISFIRGPFLNPWELQSYQPLSQTHEIIAIGADWQFYRQPIQIPGIPLKSAHLWGAGWQSIHRQAPYWLNRILSWTTGRSFGLSNLEEVIGQTDIFHAAEVYSTLTYQALQIKRRRGSRLVATVWENLPGMGETHPWRRRRKAEIIAEMDGALAVTETTQKLLIAEGMRPERIVVISPAVDMTRFYPAPKNETLAKRLGMTKDDLVVLFIGRLVREKGVLDILEAVPKVLNGVSKRPLRFLFAGSGPLEADVKRAQIETSGAVIHCPFVSYDEIPSLHNLADLFVLPSKATPKWQEQFGYVLAESMACGKAIVTTRSGSIPDVVGTAAELVPPGDASALASSLIRLLTNDSERLKLGEAALKRAHEQFDAQKNALQIEAFYERVLKQA